jgi:hypothetical protein
MPEHASRAAALFDQFEDEHRIADWGGDELFTGMPRPRAVDDAPPPRFRPAVAASEPAPRAPAPAPPHRDRNLALVEAPGDPRRVGAAEEPSDRPRPSRSGDDSMRERAERLGLSVVEPTHRWDESGAMIEPEPAGRRTKVITGHPGAAPRPLPTVRAERRRPPRTPAEWIGGRPERIVAWAFALGLILILVAVATAGAATS